MDDQLTPGPTRFDWSRLNALQVGRYAEYYVKMEFTLFGFDVYTSEVDDHGIDFVVRRDPDRYFDIQVKSTRQERRGKGFNFVFFPKITFDITRDNLFAAVVLLKQFEPPDLYLIPSTAWQNPSRLLVDHPFDKPGQRARPEWGLNFSAKTLPLLEEFRFDRVIQDEPLGASPLTQGQPTQNADSVASQ